MKKYVLTGAPCSGKTSVINELKKRGYNVLDEVARDYLEKRKELGLKDMYLCSIDEKEDAEKRMYEIQLEKESELEEKCTGKNDKIFLDRSLIDGVAYHLHFSGRLPEYIHEKLSGRYEGVFLFDRLPIVNDCIRKEGINESQEIHNMLKKTYSFYNYRTIKVPVKSIEERTDYILDYIGKFEAKK